MADTAQTTTAVTGFPCGSFGGGNSGGDAAGTGTEGTSGAQGMANMLFPLAIFVLIFYFFIIRPQRKKQKQHDDLIGGISRGDQVITIGGFLGTVREVREDTFMIELSEGVRVRILKSAIQTKRVTAPVAEEKKAE
jgi:preprotein translocase subunit YajC